MNWNVIVLFFVLIEMLLFYFRVTFDNFILFFTWYDFSSLSLLLLTQPKTELHKILHVKFQRHVQNFM